MALAPTSVPARWEMPSIAGVLFLLSAGLMLYALVTLGGAYEREPIGPMRIAVLLLTLNVYEGLLIGLGRWLTRRVGADGMVLLALEGLFLVDAAYLAAEAFTTSIPFGLTINLLLAALAVLKLRLILPALGLPGRVSLAVLATPVLLVYLLPGVLKVLADDAGNLHAGALYAAWWLTPIVPIAIAWLWRQGKATINAIALLAGISVIAHLLMTAWVYKLPWMWPFATPMLLGCGAGMLMLQRVGEFDRKIGVWVLAVLGAAASLPELPALSVGDGHLALTPMRIGLLASAALLVIAWRALNSPAMLAGASAGVLVTGVAATPQQLAGNLSAMMQFAVIQADNGLLSLRRLVPRGRFGWAVLAMVGSFFMLGIGVLISLYRGRAMGAAPTPGASS